MVPVGDEPLLYGRTSFRRVVYSIKIGTMVQVRKWGLAQAPAATILGFSSHYDLSSSTWLGYNVGVGSCEEETLCALPEAQYLAPSFHPLPAIVRIHLRPYLAARGDLTESLKAFVRTARE